MKIENFEGFRRFLASMHFPLPLMSAFVATATEGIGVVLLVLGLAIRIWTVPLMILLFVAIGFVHLQHGFGADKNGFEIPLYFLAMLLSLFATGAGRLSADYWIARHYQKTAS